MLFLLQKRVVIFLAIVAILAFSCYCFLICRVYLPNQASGIHFDSPDEMANYFFINHFKNTGNFVFDEPFNNLLAKDFVHPRSVNTVTGAIVPMSFLGMLIVYGFAAKFLGSMGILFLTPALAVGTVMLFAMILKRYFGEIAALIFAILGFFCAPFLFFANLVMMPNILFLFLVAAGAWCLARMFSAETAWQQNLMANFSGIIFGFALITRPTELLWIAAVLIAIAASARKKIKSRELFWFFLTMLVPLALMFKYNLETYDRFFTVGYLNMAKDGFLSALPDEIVVSRSPILGWLKLLLAPFGFSLSRAISAVYIYIVKLQLPLVIVAAVSFFYLLFKKEKKQLILLVVGLVVSGFIVFYYGNWVFDNVAVLRYNRISSSYARYFLPVYLILTAIVSCAMAKFFEEKRMIARAVLPVVIMALLVHSAYVAFFSADGLFNSSNVLLKNYELKSAVEQKVEQNSILLVDRADKIFWPKYKVVIFQGDFGIFPEMKKLLNIVPIYYYGEAVEPLMPQINEKLKVNGLSFDVGLHIVDNFYLYKLNTTP